MIDDATVKKIQSLGRVKTIVISHPHFYTTACKWAATFGVPVCIGSEDREWLCRTPPADVEIITVNGKAGAKDSRKVLAAGKEEDPITAVKTGGHFSGSLVLHWGTRLWIADSIMTIPVGLMLFPLPAYD